jgi:hypothetical protein
MRKLIVVALFAVALCLFTAFAYAEDSTKPIIWQLKYFVDSTCYATVHGRVSAPSADCTQPYSASVGMVVRTWDGDKIIETMMIKNFGTLEEARDWLMKIKDCFKYPQVMK